MKSLIAFAIVTLQFAAVAQTSDTQAQQTKHGMPQNWSSRYVAYSRPLTRTTNPDALNSWIQHSGKKPIADRLGTIASAGGKNVKKKKNASKVDWNVSLGSASANLAPFAYPAKFSFDLNAIPSCSNDFVAYGLATPGSLTQATVIAFRNLYSSGQANGSGMCDAANYGLPTTLFAFNTTTSLGSTINGSLALSFDGARVAFTETNALSTGSSFQVLRWGNGGGSATSPLVPDPLCITSCLFTVPLGASYTKSPYVDYSTDSAYVVDGHGAVWKINHVFNGIPVLATTDSDWPAAGYCQTSIGSSGVNSAFFVNGRVYFTEGQQTLHIVTPGSLCSEAVVTLAPQGVVVDNPLFSVLDDSHGFIFIFAKDKDGNTAVHQADLDGNVLRTATVSNDDGAAPPSGAFDNAYWLDPDASSGHLYFVNTGKLAARGASLNRLSFDNSTTMNGSADDTAVIFSTQGGVMVSSLSEISNPSNVANPDSLFLQGARKCGLVDANAGCIQSFGLTDSSFTAVAGTDETQQSGYTGGIVVDNVADPNSYGQASSIYFATVGKAVKLTQNGLQ
jgi:hypothetical protein